MRQIIDILINALKLSIQITLCILNAALFIIGILGFISNVRTKNIAGIVVSLLFVIAGLILLNYR